MKLIKYREKKGALFFRKKDSRLDLSGKPTVVRSESRLIFRWFQRC